ncbi:MAG: carbohydrate ABC transporter permease [Spirochaetia bacterium]|jgi:ABC-type glycerol-3-phosphate transport system permease component
MKALKTILNYALLVLIILVVLLPFLWVLSSSFKSETEIMGGRSYLPKHFTLQNYWNLLTEFTSSKNYPLNLFNSLVIGLGTAACTVVVAVLASYSLSRYKNKVSDAIAQTLVFVYVFPTIVVIIPLFKFLAGIGLADSFFGLVIIETAFSLPFCIWLLRSFFNSVPISFEEAALIDGASYFQAFIKTTLPLAAPGIATATIYTFIMSWGEYLFSSIFILSDFKKTVPLGLATYMADQYIEWGKLLAGGVIVIIPVLFLFYPLSRHFIRGFISGIKE